MKLSSIEQLKLRTSCARCHKLGHWARECPKGNRGPRNEERYDRRTERPEDNSKGFIGNTQSTYTDALVLASRMHRAAVPDLHMSCLFVCHPHLTSTTVLKAVLGTGTRVET